MAKLNQKFKIQNSKGEIQELDIFTTLDEAIINGEHYINLKTSKYSLNCYIGMIENLKSQYASDCYFIINREENRLRKTRGKKSFANYMQYTYPNTYQVLTEVPDLIPDTSDADYFGGMFSYCEKLQSVPMIDTSNGTNFSQMYNQCKSVTSFPKLNTSKGTNFNQMYDGCSNATSFPLIDTSKGTEFSQMYFGCKLATSFPLIDTSKGTDFSYMYESCNPNSFPLINTSNGTNFSGMYESCGNATSFPKLNTSNGLNFGKMYYYCDNASDFPQLDTSKGTNFSYMYFFCSNISGILNIDISSITTETYRTALSDMFRMGRKTPNCTVVFNNVPQGITEDDIRTATKAPRSIDITLNYR